MSIRNHFSPLLLFREWNISAVNNRSSINRGLWASFTSYNIEIIWLRSRLEIKDLILEAEFLIQFFLINKAFFSCAITGSSIFLGFWISISIFFSRVIVLLPELHLISTFFGSTFLLRFIDDSFQDKFALTWYDNKAFLWLSILS